MAAAVYSSTSSALSVSPPSFLHRRRQGRTPPSFSSLPNPRETSSRRGSVRVKATTSPSLAKTMEWTIHSAAALTGRSWQSSLASNAVIFALGSPLLLAGLNLPGIVAAFFLGTLTWRAFGPPAFLLVAAYFVLGTAATKVRLAQKEAEGVAERRKGRRGPASVLGSSAAGCVCALLSLYLPDNHLHNLSLLGFVGSFCTKLSDTVSSEIGKAYGNTTYLVTTFKVVPRGTEGAVSVEGTVAGLSAATLFAALAYFMRLIDAPAAVICVAASQIANFGESLIGASLQDKEGFQWLNNDVVNIINISVGCILAVLMQQMIMQVC